MVDARPCFHPMHTAMGWTHQPKYQIGLPNEDEGKDTGHGGHIHEKGDI
jgi:hypothetical protein